MMKNWHKVSLVYRVYQSKPFSSPESVKTVRWEVCVYGGKDYPFSSPIRKGSPMGGLCLWWEGLTI